MKILRTLIFIMWVRQCEAEVPQTDSNEFYYKSVTLLLTLLIASISGQEQLIELITEPHNAPLAHPFGVTCTELHHPVEMSGFGNRDENTAH